LARRRGAAAFIAVAVLAAVSVAAALTLRSSGSTTDIRAGSSTPSAIPTSPKPSATPASQADPFGSAAKTPATGDPGTLLAAVYDVTTGQQWTLGTGKPQAEASIVKLDILETLLARYHGETLPSADLPVAQLMMEDSDNDAATSLWYASNGPTGIGSYNAAAGLHGTTMSSCVECAGFAWPGWGLTTTTPADQIVLLRQLISSRSLLSAQQRGYVLGLMENVTPEQRWGVTGGVPSGVTVALKNGWLPLDAADDDWQINSIGWINGDGRDYVMAVLSTGNATEQDGIDLIDKLSSTVWANLSPDKS
jgi:beta-lactamase class A